ncbi:MAG: transposase [Opitutales bacterium]
MKVRRVRAIGVDATYHCMTRAVNGARLFGDGEKEVLRKMIWQVADFCGVEVLTYCVMSNHFHVLVRVPVLGDVSDRELLRRYKVLYPRPTKYQTASIALLEKELAKGGAEADAIREKLLARMGDVSEYMKAVKQRFSVWYNRSHGRFGTLWAERFKSVLVEGKGNPLQTMAAYIDLNSVRAGMVEDPKDYRFCGYAEAVAGQKRAQAGLAQVWSTRADGSVREQVVGANHAVDGLSSSRKAGSWRSSRPPVNALQLHRELIFGKRAADPGLSAMSREKVLKVLEQQDAVLPKAVVLRCRVRYFTDGAILGSHAFVQSFVGSWQLDKRRKFAPKPNLLRGADWQGLATIQGLRKQVFG